VRQSHRRIPEERGIQTDRRRCDQTALRLDHRRKEFLEALRDRRTLFILIVLPILLYPMLVTLISRLQESQEAEQKAKASRVALWANCLLI